MKRFQFLFCMFSLLNQFTASHLQVDNVTGQTENKMVITASDHLPDTHGGETMDEPEESRSKTITVTSILF